MGELSWQGILQSQQQDFIKRLKNSLHSDLPITLSCLDYNPFCNESCHSELIRLSLNEPEEEEIHDYCEELVYKFRDEYDPDEYTNYKIGKIGEIAVKAYLGSAVTGVNYEIYERGDGGIDFYLTSNQKNGIQVKTKALGRITNNDVIKYDLNINERWSASIDFEMNYSDRIDAISWPINQTEINKNKLLICVLLLNWIEVDQIQGDLYKCVMAGFKPTGEIKYAQSFKMKDLFYSGGIRGYLESLT